METGGPQREEADAPKEATGVEEECLAFVGTDISGAEAPSPVTVEAASPPEEPATLAKPSGSPWDDFSTEYIEKYEKYQSGYIRRVQAKYFSKKTFSGEDIFDDEVTIQNEVIRCSRWPCARSYLNPVLSSQEPSGLSSTAEASSLSNRSCIQWRRPRGL